jgi:diaminohydroxyphosphoribosylaminopyrimidine deaminase/5-amino-6-(5-phosphoribosylamino)uracil reductase
MTRALELAARGRGKTSPNPMVGAVIVKNGRVIAEGYHRKAGTDHAEVVALKKAGSNARGATVYVTLEPCCHTGNTGPCTDALIRSGVKRVVFASVDPDPRVRGRGARRLRQAGIQVTTGVLKQEAERLNEVFYGYNRNGRPFVTLKLAQSLDGRIATRTGDSQWISSPKSLRFAHELRAEADAVMVGMGTVRRDNPSLTVRAVRGRNPYRIVVTRSARFPKSCELLQNNSDLKTIVATTEERARRLVKSRQPVNLTFWDVKPAHNGALDVADLIRKAGEFGLRHILVEGGAALATSLLKAHLVDKLVLIVAPKIIGDGVDSFGDLGIRRLADNLELRSRSVRESGPDMIITGYLK